MKIIPRALSAGLALAAVPAQAFVTYQDIVSAATNPDDLSRQALVTIFGDVVTNPLTASSNTHQHGVEGVPCDPWGSHKYPQQLTEEAI